MDTSVLMFAERASPFSFSSLARFICQVRARGWLGWETRGSETFPRRQTAVRTGSGVDKRAIDFPGWNKPRSYYAWVVNENR